METNDFNQPDFSNGGTTATLDSFLPDVEKPIEVTPVEEKPTAVLEKEIEIALEGDKPIKVVKVEEEKPTVATPKVEVTKEDLEKEKQPTPSLESLTEGVDYKGLTSQLIEKGVWSNIDAFGTEEGEVPFEDMDINEETFFDIMAQQKDILKDELLEGKVSVEGTSEFTKKLIEIEKNGGDVQQALNSFQQVKNPLESLDLANTNDQQHAIALKLNAQGVDEDIIKRTIKSYVADGTLEDKAVEAKEQLESAFDNQLKQINEDAVQANQERAGRLKEYRTNLKTSLNNFDLNDSYKKRLLDTATKEDSAGNFKLDELYSEVRKNPELAAELTLYLTDKNEYIKQVSKEAVRENKIKDFRKLNLINKGGSKIDLGSKGSDKRESTNFIDLSNLG